MSELFSAVLKASFQGSLVILAVLVLRLLLKRAPKSIFCLLWLLAGVRLVLPFEIQSPFSLQPRLEDTQISIQAQQPVQTPDISVQNPEGQPLETPAEPVVPPEIPEGNWDDVQTDSYIYGEKDGVITEPVDPVNIAAWVWFLGAAVMLSASVVSYWKLKRRVREAYLLENGCFECPGLDTAFVLGFFPPRIYLPLGLTDQEKKFIFDHENTHIARHDHWFKVLGYGVLSIHWFNPLVWLAYSLLCRDMELACDEHVVKYMTLPQRKAYSAALLSCGGHTARIAACPVAFGESNPKKRILNVLNYKRPGFWITMLAVVAVVFVSVCLLTSPENQAEHLEETETGAWNLEMELMDVSSTGLVVKFVQTGIFHGSDRGQLMYGTDYTLEKLEAGQWVAVEALPQENPVGWATVGYTIGLNSIANHHIDWDWLYGQLPAGHYRIGKRVTLDYPLDDDQNQMFYAEFTIGDSGLQQCVDALETLQSRDVMHILENYTFSGQELPESQITRHYFQSGATWIWIEGTEHSDYAQRYLYTGEKLYTSASEDLDFQWEPAEKAVEDIPLSWLLTFDFANADAELISREETQKGDTLRVMIHESVDMGWLQGEEYYVDFAFDRDGKLLRAEAHVSSGFQELTAYMMPIDLSRTAVENTIGQYAGALVDMELTEADYLAMCRNAVAELQNREQFHISETLAYFTGDTEDSRSNVVFWRDGDNWLRQSYVTRMRENRNLLYYDGMLYMQWQQEGKEASWGMMKEDSPESQGYPWLGLVQWDDRKVVFDDAGWVEEELRVSVFVHDTPPTLGWDHIQEYGILFFFDNTGNLTRAIMTAVKDNIEVIDDLKIETTLGSNIHSKIETLAAQWPGVVKADMTQEQWLEKCRAALEDYQSQGTWAIQSENSFWGQGATNTSSTSQWFGCGNDYYTWTSIPEDGGTGVWYDLCVDGMAYHRNVYAREGGTTEDWETQWEEGSTDNQVIYPHWPLWYDWDDANIEFEKADAFAVSFTVQGSPFPGEHGINEYRVTFEFHVGVLDFIQIEYSQTDGLSNTIHVQKCFSLYAFAPGTAQSMIRQCHNEALLHVHGICNDPDCTDTSHNHDEHHDDNHH